MLPLLLCRRLSRANALNYSTEILWQVQPLKFRIGVAADILQIAALVLAAETNGDAICARTRSPPNPVNILLWHIGKIEIDHMANARNINSASSHIGRDQNIGLAALKLAQSPLTLRLAFIAMDRVRANAALIELFDDPVRAMLGPSEDQNPLQLTGHIVPL